MKKKNVRNSMEHRGSPTSKLRTVRACTENLRDP